MRKIIFPALGLFGLFLGLFMVFLGRKEPPIPPIAFPPPSPPFKHVVVGSGLIEGASEEIKIGVPFSEIVESLYTHVGEYVLEGAPLFRLNTKILEAELLEAEKIKEALYADYEKIKTERTLYESLVDQRATSKNQLNSLFFEEKKMWNRFKEAEAHSLLIKTKIERSTIRAPMDGQVLQMNIRLGESANINPFNNLPSILFAQTNRLRIRAEIDEDEAWRVVKNAKAIAYVRGNSSLCVWLKFLYIEPYIVPKSALSGSSGEKVDTRVLQVLYEFEKNDLPVYPGQIMDVYIEAPSDQN